MYETRGVLVALVIALYPLAVRWLRYRRVDAIKRKHGMRNRSDYAKLTADQGQDVLKDLVELEFPKLMGFSIVFALFKTYGIPTVSSLLVTTGELSGPETASKRTADTGVLLLEFCLNKPSSDRGREAISRMNYLHSRYIRAGKISNDDLLYTLSLFALEPIRWIDKYEWRSFSDFEFCATGTFWKAIGDMMQIDFSLLPSAKSGWVDGMQWLDEVKAWSEEYEQTNMIPSKTNHQLALAHLDVIFINLPKGLKYVGKAIVSVLLGERVRTAMMLPEPAASLAFAIDRLLYMRKLILRHLILPRPELLRKRYIPVKTEDNGRYSSQEYLSHPWYVKPTFERRWGARAWVTRFLGRKLPGDDDNKYHPEGYVISGVGPSRLSKSGSKEMQTDLTKFRMAKAGLCPFATPKE